MAVMFLVVADLKLFMKTWNRKSYALEAWQI